ncbi:diacylglycerol kinase [Paramicrobacterium humi]|uniref:Diacylglycerol kinase n=1 Tax=Paramicrobacterium humi TaxID=640635 RepID=A0A1H4THW1_9MICO|nr:YegS/Rv2252/BmrU family lipid kinase [Microbacterium humi]SEC56076.1 diacylglycerol kinase [Microbacterium humi]
MTRDRLRIAVAINPAASFGAHAHVGREFAAALADAGVDVTVLLEKDAATLRTAIEAAVREAPDALVAVGGDGLVHLAVGALAGTDVPLGIVPTGTGNDLARGLRLPLGDHAAAAERVLAALERKPTRIDIGIVRSHGAERRFAGVLSVGFDARVNERANRWRWPRGRVRYILALVRELAGLRPHRFRLTLDGAAGERDAIMLSVANNGYMGGGMAIAPHALLHDGLLDVVTVAPLTRLRLLRLFPRVFTGTHLALQEVTVERARRVHIEADDVVAYADGERIGVAPLSVEVLEGALAVLV